MRLLLFALYVLMGSLVFAIPNMSRRELLFAVPVPPDFRDSRPARHALARFRFIVAAAAFAGALMLLLAPARMLAVVSLVVPLATMLTAGIAYYSQYRKLAPAAIQYTGTRQAELSPVPESLPWFASFAAGPFAILAAAAAWLSLNWNRIPARFPVHYGVAGQPDRWAERTTRGVFGVLIFGAEICAYLLFVALACWFGARRSPSRPFVLGCVIAMEYWMGVLFGLIALQPALHLPVFPIAAAPAVFLVAFIAIVFRRIKQAREPLDPTPNQCWTGDIYYNPGDAALFVERRAGFGYTFNFANRWSWVLLLALVPLIGSAFFLMP